MADWPHCWWALHKPELALVGESFKVGLELWKYPGISLVAEIVALFGGMYFYMRGTRAAESRGKEVARARTTPAL